MVPCVLECFIWIHSRRMAVEWQVKEYNRAVLDKPRNFIAQERQAKLSNNKSIKGGWGDSWQIYSALDNIAKEFTHNKNPTPQLINLSTAKQCFLTAVISQGLHGCKPTQFLHQKVNTDGNYNLQARNWLLQGLQTDQVEINSSSFFFRLHTHNIPFH